MTERRQHLSELPSLALQVQRVFERTPVAVVAGVVGLVTLLVHGYRLGVAPDAFSDEGLYLRVSTNLARGAGLTLDDSLFLWHPPAYMFVEAAYIKLAGLSHADPVTALVSVRYLNIFFSAGTAVLVMLFGRKLHSYQAGLAAAALFLMDPYVQRINRRGMLETLAMLFVLLGLYIFFTRRPQLTMRQRVGAGLAFGLAMLTKEAMLLELLGLVAYVVWSRRSQLRDVAWVAAIACAVYLPYPAWVVAIGQGDRYLFYQQFGITRVLHSIPGYPAPETTSKPAPRGTFSPANLQNLIAQYEMSYLLICLAALFTVILILRCRDLLAARYLITWTIVSFGIGLALGRTSDQYFYYLMVPSTIVAGYVLSSLPRGLAHRHSSETNAVIHQPRPASSRSPIPYAMVWKPIVAAFVVMFSYNSYVWATRYVVGSDDAYIKAMQYVRSHIPSGETIVTSNDVAYYFLSPSYNIRLDRSRKEIVARCERYFIMSSKDAWARYNLTTPEFYEWVVKNSEPLFVQEDRSFWTIGVYKRATGQQGACRASRALEPHVPEGLTGIG
jgi:4-amino-4-deoxy-L-arabinose transferase-like glycosyltransferase